jgi:hypothetical protein
MLSNKKKFEQIKQEQMKQALEDIFKCADDVMGEPNIGAKELMVLRWIKKLARRGLGESDD